MNDEANNFAVADHLVEVIFDRLLAKIVGPLLAGLGESLLLGREPGRVRIEPMKNGISREKEKNKEQTSYDFAVHWRLLFLAMFTISSRFCDVALITLRWLSSLKAQES